jgi:hypothetical protein
MDRPVTMGAVLRLLTFPVSFSPSPNRINLHSCRRRAAGPPARSEKRFDAASLGAPCSAGSYDRSLNCPWHGFLLCSYWILLRQMVASAALTALSVIWLWAEGCWAGLTSRLGHRGSGTTVNRLGQTVVLNSVSITGSVAHVCGGVTRFGGHPC